MKFRIHKRKGEGQGLGWAIVWEEPDFHTRAFYLHVVAGAYYYYIGWWESKGANDG